MVVRALPVALLLLLPASACEPGAPAASPSAVQTGAAGLDRDERLAAQRRRIERQIVAQEAAGGEAEEARFLAALRSIVDALPDDQDERTPFVKVRDGCIPPGSFTSFVRWNSPRPGRTLQVALDLELPNHPFGGITDLERQLRARGVDLLLVVVPTRLEIHPELVLDAVPERDAAAPFAGMGLATQRFLLELQKAGVETLSLTGPFAQQRRADRPAPEQLYLRTDPHWTPRGAELAAQLVAEELARYPWFAPGPVREGAGFRIEPRQNVYEPNESLIGRGAEVEVLAANALWDAAGEVFDPTDAASPIVVLGDSYVRLYSATGCDFCSQLARFTGWKLDVIQSFGGAAEQVRRKLARREPAQWTGKKLVLWVVPETLLVPTEWWKPVPLGP